MEGKAAPISDGTAEATSSRRFVDIACIIHVGAISVMISYIIFHVRGSIDIIRKQSFDSSTW